MQVWTIVKISITIIFISTTYVISIHVFTNLNLSGSAHINLPNSAHVNLSGSAHLNLSKSSHIDEFTQ